MSDVVQNVGEKSRSDGRESVPGRVDRLRREREQLAMKKREIEGRLSELDAKRKEEQAEVFKRRLSHTDQIVATTMIESRFHKGRASVLKELNNTLEELAIIKQSLSRVETRHPGDEILLRIEALLIQILRK